MTADCRCTNGHEFSSRVVNWEPDVNVFETEAEVCPVCGADYEATNTYSDED